MEDKQKMGIFKAYDIRGTYPDELDEAMARRIGAATAQFLRGREIAVGRDMRLSSESMAAALMEGIASTGTNVIDLGLIATEMSYFAVGNFGYAGAIMTTASHNPAKYNGFKLSREHAMPIGGETGLTNIQTIVESGLVVAAARKGTVTPKDIYPGYKEHILRFLKQVKPLRVVVDAGNGMAGKVFPYLFGHLPLTVTPLYFELDGRFPNHEANPLKPENIRELQDKVVATAAHFGVAFDGDSDRCVFIEETGRAISADLTTALIARWLLTQEKKEAAPPPKGSRAPQKGTVVVYDLRSSRVVAEEISRAGGIPCQERVGHAFMKATLRKRNAIFGGELAGHYYYRDNYFADSAMITFVMMLNIICAEDKPLSQIIAPLRRYSATGEINFEVTDQDAKIRELAKRFAKNRIHYLDGITVEADEWWFNVRKSNTEPVLRLNLEANTPEIMERAKQEVVKVIKS
jgi:phosphomannomutase